MAAVQHMPGIRARTMDVLPLISRDGHIRAEKIKSAMLNTAASPSSRASHQVMSGLLYKKKQRPDRQKISCPSGLLAVM